MITFLWTPADSSTCRCTIPEDELIRSAAPYDLRCPKLAKLELCSNDTVSVYRCQVAHFARSVSLPFPWLRADGSPGPVLVLAGVTLLGGPHSLPLIFPSIESNVRASSIAFAALVHSALHRTQLTLTNAGLKDVIHHYHPLRALYVTGWRAASLGLEVFCSAKGRNLCGWTFTHGD